MSLPLQQAVLVTIIGESVLQDRLVQLMKTLKIAGYTITQAQGAGSHGSRMADIAGYKTNVEFRTIVSSETSEPLLSAVKEYQAKYAIIAFRQPVEALVTSSLNSP